MIDSYDERAPLWARVLVITAGTVAGWLAVAALVIGVVAIAEALL